MAALESVALKLPLLRINSAKLDRACSRIVRLARKYPPWDRKATLQSPAK